MANQRIPWTVTGRGAPGFPVTPRATSIATAPPVIVPGTPVGQPLGVSIQSVSQSVPAMAANTPMDLSFTIPIVGFPSPFLLSKNSVGTVTASVLLQATPSDENTLVGLPAVSLTFGVGLTAPGTGQWTLTGGTTYQNPQLSVTVRVVALANAKAQTLSFVGQATLIGTPVTPTTPTV